VFGRYEYVRKSAEDLIASGAAPDQGYDINSLVAGFIREIASIPGGTIGVGFRGSVNLIPRSLEPTYGTRAPVGFGAYVRVRPKRMAMAAEMSPMPMMRAHEMKMSGHGT
jgi:hypothetical protein